MKAKHLFTIIIALLFLAALYFYHDTMTLGEIIGAFAANSLLITTIWQWFSKEEIKMKYRWSQNQLNKTSMKLANLQEDYYQLAEEHLNQKTKDLPHEEM